MSYWKNCCTICISLFLISLPDYLIQACGYYPIAPDAYSFVKTNLAGKHSKIAPYLLTFDDFYQTFDEMKIARRSGNLQEWRDNFCKQAPMKDVAYVIYAASEIEIASIKKAAKHKNDPLDYRLKDNDFAAQLVESKCLDVLDYLIFAKQCEPHVTAEDEWDNRVRDKTQMMELAQEGVKQFRRCDSHWVKLRYAYQIVRLAHYAKEYQKALDFYDYLLPKMDYRESIINDWLLGHRAGALKQLGKKVEASYLFSKIFKNSPSKRESAYRSFSIESNEEWEACLKLCESDEERSTLYTMRAMDPKSKALEEMKKIHQLYPESPDLEAVLYREIKRLEKIFLGHTFKWDNQTRRRFYDKPTTESGKYLLELQEFVQRCVQEEKVGHLQLWELADGYLEYLSGDLYSAEKTFAAIAPRIEDKQLKEQLDVFRLTLEIHALQTMNHEEEKQVSDIMRNNILYRKYNKDFKPFLFDRMAQLYEKNGHPGKAHRCHFSIYSMEYNPKLDALNDLLAIYEEPENNFLEKKFITNKGGKDIKNILLDIKGTYLLGQGELGSALRTFNLIPRAERDEYQFNPFIERFDDCVHCPLPDTVATFYNKNQIAKLLLDFDYKSKADPEKGAQYFYLLGNAYYNMSYYGHSWNVMDYYRSSSTNMAKDENGDGIVYNDIYWIGGEKDVQFTNIKKALYHFEKARALTFNPELAAKASFMAAKCERNAYLVSKDFDWKNYSNNRYLPPDEYLLYFRYLKEKYSETGFFEEIIEECSYLRNYLQR